MAGIVVGTTWPRLRPDLALYPGPLSAHGSPTWTLHDQARHRFFRLGWLEFEIMSRWSLGDAGKIAAAVSHETPIHAEARDVDALVHFVQNQNLTVSDGPDDSARLARQKNSAKPSWWLWLLRNYLFIRLTLLRPDKFLSRIAPRLSWIAGKNFLRLTVALSLVGIYLIWRQWALFFDSLARLASHRGWLLIGASLVLVKAAHEFGHAIAAKSYGCRVPAMGVALMCFFPVAWTDTTEAWKLPKRSQRLAIDSAGVLVEIFIAAIASLAWSVLPPSPLKTVCFVLASTTWITSLLINLSPFLRYDGYYLLSDYLDEPQLRTRSFALGRWKMREFLFGWGDPPPEYVEPSRKRTLIIYAYATWLYRFFLFLGIALMVYHFFFKALGIVLMAVEVVWFVGAPIAGEIKQWLQRSRGSFRFSKSLRTALLLLLLITVLIYPWQGSISGPALLVANDQHRMYTPVTAIVRELLVENGQEVKRGQILLRLSSPEIDHEISISRQKIRVLQGELEAMSQNRGLMTSYGMTVRELEGLQAKVAGLNEVREQLVLKAPFDGVVRDLPLWIRAGGWAQPDEVLGIVVSGEGRIEIFVAEQDVSRLGESAQGEFYPAGGYRPSIPIVLSGLNLVAVDDLAHPSLSSSYGGPIAVNQTDDAKQVPENSLYMGYCGVRGKGVAPSQSIRGQFVLDGKPVSLVSMIWRNVVGLLIRESGWR